MGRSSAKRDKEIWDAVERDMKKKGPGAIRDYYSGRTTPPPPRMAPKPPKPANKRTGPDFLDQKPKKKRKSDG